MIAMLVRHEDCRKFQAVLLEIVTHRIIVTRVDNDSVTRTRTGQAPDIVVIESRDGRDSHL
jgi:hypothetical protein